MPRLAMLPIAILCGLQYPAAPYTATTDVYFGEKVADPFRRLEDLQDPQTQAWVAAESRLSASYLNALPEREALRERLALLWSYERYDLVRKKAGNYFYSRNSGSQNQSILYVQDGANGKARILLDPNTLSADGTVALTEFEVSPNAQYIVYATAAAGSDWSELHVRNVASGTDEPDRLTRVKFSGIAWTHDNRGFFYARYPAQRPGQAGTFEKLANQKLYYHRLGADQSQDILIAESTRHPGWMWGQGIEVTEDGRYLVVSISQSASDRVAVWIKDLGRAATPNLTAPFKHWVTDFNCAYRLLGSRGDVLYFATTRGAERGRIVATDLRTARWHSVVPEKADTLDTAVLAGNEIVAVYTVDAVSHVRRFSLTGTPLGEIALPGNGHAQLSAQSGDPELFYSYTSFNQPATQYVLNLVSGDSRLFQPMHLEFDPASFVTEQVFYTTADGTRIPLFISYKKGIKPDGRNPTLLYGYGGFGASRLPEFSVAHLLWMENGGIYAHANLRGGGEYGEAWHRAGSLEHKQNVFDDFAAAARYLIAQSWTTPQHLAVIGRSNGGLLVGATVNQHPDLFAAAVAGVGIMDMLRYHDFTIGAVWADEYGTSNTQSGFRVLRAYSPYHNITAGVRYPAVLISTADHDDRVMPAHSYKYAAALQAAVSMDGQVGERPVLLRIEANAGHGTGEPASKQIEEAADELAFLLHFTR